MIKIIVLLSILVLSISAMAEDIAICTNEDSTIQVVVSNSEEQFSFDLFENGESKSFPKVRAIEVNYPGFMGSDKNSIPRALILFSDTIEDDLYKSHLYIINSIIPRHVNMMCDVRVDLENL